MQQRPPRPTGVAILAVLAILGGLAGLFGGAVLISAGIYIGTNVSTTQITDALNNAGYPGLASQVASVGAGTISALAIVLGIVALVIGILYLAGGIGFLRGRGWAWTLGIIVTVLGLIRAISSIAFGNYTSAVDLIISLLILYYLTRAHVKAYFGKGSMTQPMTGGMMSASTMSSMSSPSVGAMMKCPACGAMAPAGATKCPSCGAML